MSALRLPNPSHQSGTFAALAATILLGLAGLARAQTPNRSEKPAEETRLDTAAFRAGLSKRGLTELLELHIKDFPPKSETESRLMLRDIKLAEAKHPARATDERRELIAEANDILEEVIALYSDDERRFEWRFELARSLIYNEAEPYLTSILYRGGNNDDRRRLLAISSRAVDALTMLLEQIAGTFEQIDRMPIPEFERLDAAGSIQRLDDLEPKAKYLLLWARFYDALPRPDNDPVRIRHLNILADLLTSNANVVRTPHDATHVQVQALVLAGMTYRRLHRHQRAREYMDRALRVVAGLGDSKEARRVQWAATLARIERVRNEVDDGQFEDALRYLDALRTVITPESKDAYGLRVVAALLERSVYLRAADMEEADEQIEHAQRFRATAWKALAALVADEPERRDELYAALYATMDPNADPDDLDPVERSALIAGLLHESSLGTDDRQESLDHVIAVGNHFLGNVPVGAERLLPEVLYNLAVAEYRRGDRFAGASRFLEVARDHPTFAEALSATELAVQLAAAMYGDPALVTRNDVSRLYRDALELLIGRYTDSEAARYWLFYYAQLLEQSGEYIEAAKHYARVLPDHEHHLDSEFAQMRCLALALHERSTDDRADLIEFRRHTNEYLAAQRRFVTSVTAELGRESDEARIAKLRRMLADTHVLTGEVQILSSFHRPAQTLEALAGFEAQFPDQPSLYGRVWRIRLICYEQLGRLKEAMETIPAYIAAAPSQAGATLQRLYLSLAAEADERLEKNDEVVAQKKAEMALVLARQVHQWASNNNVWDVVGGEHALILQLAEANLRAGQLQRAEELFEGLSTDRDGQSEAPPPLDLRFDLGYAETLYRLGKLAAALPHFNRLATALPPTNSIRWKAMLRDLQCRTALREPPQGIINVIEQQKFFHPELGGPKFSPQFEKLLRQNKRRAEGA